MLGLPPKLLANLAEMNITKPTPIQTKAIPHAMNGRDVMGLAQTGTGKTAAFGLPIVSALLRIEGKPDPKAVRGLILAPPANSPSRSSRTCRATPRARSCAPTSWLAVFPSTRRCRSWAEAPTCWWPPQAG